MQLLLVQTYIRVTWFGKKKPPANAAATMAYCTSAPKGPDGLKN